MRKKRKSLLIIAAIVVFLIAFWWFETFTLSQSEITIADTKINGEITIVQLSDLHGASFGHDNQRLIDKIIAAEPDLIAVTGDMYSAGDEQGQATALSLLTRLAQNYPVYFVNGEHDNDDDFKQSLIDGGVHVLDYGYEKLLINGTQLCLYGINNVYYSPTFDLHNEFELDSGVYNILLAHIANFGAFADLGVDLSLCGDTHGGQIRLPWVGAINNRGVWFPEVNRVDDGNAEYTKGLYELGEAKLFVCSGLGNYPLPFRLFNRPEIAIIHLVGENQS